MAYITKIGITDCYMRGVQKENYIRTEEVNEDSRSPNFLCFFPCFLHRMGDYVSGFNAWLCSGEQHTLMCLR